jgi:hypothetical protein
MVIDSFFDVRQLYILKDGVPIFHWSYDEENGDSSNISEKKDTALVSGFLSAIVNFANEMGIGKSRSYLTNDKKFSFLSKKDFLFVILVDKQNSDDKTFEFLNIVSKTFIKVYDVGDFHNLSAINLNDFKNYLLEIITKLNSKDITDEDVNEEELIKDAYKRNEYKNMVPKCYIDLEKTHHLSSSRRSLFKLIDGSNSIFKIAEEMNQSPQDIFFTLKPYEKFGYVRITQMNQPPNKENM